MGNQNQKSRTPTSSPVSSVPSDSNTNPLENRTPTVSINTLPTQTPKPIVSVSKSPTEAPGPTVADSKWPTETPGPIISASKWPTETPGPTVADRTWFTETPGPTVADSKWPVETPGPTVGDSTWFTEAPGLTVGDSKWPTETPGPTVGDSTWSTETPGPTVGDSTWSTETPGPTVGDSTWFTETPGPTVCDSKWPIATLGPTVGDSTWFTETPGPTVGVIKQPTETPRTSVGVRTWPPDTLGPIIGVIKQPTETPRSTDDISTWSTETPGPPTFIRQPTEIARPTTTYRPPEIPEPLVNISLPDYTIRYPNYPGYEAFITENTTLRNTYTNIFPAQCELNEESTYLGNYIGITEEETVPAKTVKYINLNENELFRKVEWIQMLNYDFSTSAETEQQEQKEKTPTEEELPKIKNLDAFNVRQKNLMDKFYSKYGKSCRFLTSYGFLREHCLEALIETNGDEDLSLILLYNNYLIDNSIITEEVQMSRNTSLQLRKSEICILKSRYKQYFTETNNLWSFKLTHGALKNQVEETNNMERNFIIDFFLSSKYPAIPPLILLRPNKCVESPLNLMLSKRLYQAAQKFCKSKYPCLLVLTFWEYETELRNVLYNAVDFTYPEVSSEQNKESLTRETEVNLSEILRQDRSIVNEYRQRKNLPEYREMQEIRAKLPAFKKKLDILDSIRNNQIIILKGETGCGKSTQVPQFIFDEWIETFKKNERHVEIVCTQPRRISALGVATRVAAERVDRVGHTVGYQIRFDHCISDNTRLTFCTMGVLLKRIQREPTLDTVSHIIVDEVHERSAEGDLLLLILKNLLPLRKDIRVILMSATVDTNLLSQYFGGVPITDIPGRTFQVEQIFLEDLLENNVKYEIKITSSTPIVDRFENSVFFNQENTVPDTLIEDEKLTLKQLRLRYKGYSELTCQTISNTNVNTIDYALILKALEWIRNGVHQYPRVGTVLIFMPGYAEIFNMLDELYSHDIFSDRRKYILIPLHSSLPTEEQNKIFNIPKHDQSKIILSTNIAETSITIEDCIFVIDTGKMKQKNFDANTNIESLDTIWVSKANAIQRKGRAGRVRAGLCIHLYTKHRFEYNFIPHPISEIQRIPVDSLILYMKVLINYDYNNIREVFNDFIEPPPADNIKRGVMNLQLHQVIDASENLTPIGFHLASLPLDVMPGKLLIYGVVFDCLDATLTMAAYMSHKSPFLPPNHKNKKEITEKKKSVAELYSDQITVFRLYRTFTEIYRYDKQEAGDFLREHFLSFKVMNEIKQIKYQLLQCLITMGFVILDSPLKVRSDRDDIYTITDRKYNQNEHNGALLSSIMCAAFYPNIVTIRGKRGRKYPGYTIRSCEPLYPIADSSAAQEEQIKIDPKSVNFSTTVFPYDHLIFQEKEKRSNKLIFQESTLVSIKSLVLFSNSDFVLEPLSSVIYLEKGTIQLSTGSHMVALLISALRNQLHELINAVCKDPAAGLQNRGKGQEVIAAVIEFIDS